MKIKFNQTPLVYGDDLRDFKMPFGEFKGEPFYEIRRNYLEWVLENCPDIDANLRVNIDNYLNLKFREE